MRGGGTIRRYRTPGGSMVLVDKHPGPRWRRYTYHCYGCDWPRRTRCQFRSVAKCLAWWHSGGCDVTPMVGGIAVASWMCRNDNCRGCQICQPKPPPPPPPEEDE